MSDLLALSIRTGTILRIDTDTDEVCEFHADAGPYPDGITIIDGQIYWTTMGQPDQRPGLGDGEAALDYSAPTGAVFSLPVTGGSRTQLTVAGQVTTGKQITHDDDRLYWSDREGHKVSSCRFDGSDHRDLVVNPPGADWNDTCVGVCVADDYLYWTQKGPAKGGTGRILRTPLGEALAVNGPVPAGSIETLWSGLPEPIDLEAHDGWLYWTDRGTPPDGNTLNRSRIPAPGQPGDNIEILSSGFGEAIGLAICPEAGEVYVTDLAGDLRVMTLPTGSRPSRVVKHIATGHRLTGVALLP